ncbi:MAG: COMPASS component SWD3 [Mariniblastus sp.]|jgi:COMPASS component SWD3
MLPSPHLIRILRASLLMPGICSVVTTIVIGISLGYSISQISPAATCEAASFQPAAQTPEALPDQEATVDEIPQHSTWRIKGAEDANGIYRLKYSPDGNLLATRNRNNTVSIYNVTTRELLCAVDGHENNWVETIDFSSDSKFFVTAAGSGEVVKIWDAQTGQFKSEIKSSATAAYFDPSGDSIHVMGEAHVETYSWPGVQKTSQRKWKNGTESGVGMSHDGRVVVTFRKLNRNVYRTQVIDLESKSKVQLDGPTGTPRTVAISPNRYWLAVQYDREEDINLWDLRDPRQKKYKLERHAETVQSLAFSPDSRMLASSSWDETVIVWDLLSRGMLKQFLGHTEHVNATAFSPQMAIASGASGATDTSTILWDIKEFVLLPATEPQPSFEETWDRLGAPGLTESLEATGNFIAGGDRQLAGLEKQVAKYLQGNASNDLAETIQLLNHVEWAVREKATKQLFAIRGKSDVELRRALDVATSPETRYRLGLVLKQKLERVQMDPFEARRWSRVVFALEQINTDRTQKLLQQMAASSLGFEVAIDAKQSFERNLERRRRPPAG